MPAVAEIVRRLWERQRAGTRPAPTFCCLEVANLKCTQLLAVNGKVYN